MNAIVLKPDLSIKYTNIEEYHIQNEDDVIIKVCFAGLCGSDMHRMNPANQTPLLDAIVLGHEISGQIFQIGNKVQNLVEGDKVTVLPLFYELAKENNYPLKIIGSVGKTINGGFAEYIKVPAENVFKISDELPLEAAALTDVAAAGIHSYNLAGRPINRKIAIIGDGSIGLANMQIFKHYKNDVNLIGKHNNSLITELSGNQSHFYNQELNNTYDIVIETVGRAQSSTINQAIALTKPQGIVIFEGVFPEQFQAQINIREALYKELHIQGANSYQPQEFKEALALMQSEALKMDQIVTHKLPLLKFIEGVEAMKNKNTSNAIKILYYP
ncbi:MAG: alcohol dehydrogenase catalytic domain-containing protein [Candidatus Nanoarchaeia archaeon]